MINGGSIQSQMIPCITCARLAAGGFGSFLLAIYDGESEEFQSISKIGTGFSEELLKELSDQLKEFVIPHAPRYYRYLHDLLHFCGDRLA